MADDEGSDAQRDDGNGYNHLTGRVETLTRTAVGSAVPQGSFPTAVNRLTFRATSMTARTRSYLFAVHGRPDLYNEAYPGETIGSIGVRRKVVLSTAKTLLARTVLASTATTNTEPAAPTAKEPATIYHHGGRGYSLDGRNPVTVSDSAHCILSLFAMKPTAMTRREIEAKAGVLNAPQALARLCDYRGGLFRDAVSRPGNKSNGGYFLRVKPAE